MTTHEKQDPTVATTAPDPEVNNVSVDAYNDEDVAAVMVDIENQQQQPPRNSAVLSSKTTTIISMELLMLLRMVLLLLVVVVLVPA